MILILSPHLDDALFSMTNYLLHYKGEVVICTLFTKSYNKINFEGDYKYYADTKTRKTEDYTAIQKLLNINSNLKIKMIYLELYDNLFRYYLKNYSVENKIIELFTRIKNNYKFDKIFCPLGIGNHNDHLLTFKCANIVFNYNLLNYYYDYPYCNLKINKFNRFNQLKINHNIKLTFQDFKNYYYYPMYNSTNFFIKIFRITNIFFQYIYQKIFINKKKYDTILHTNYYNYQKKFQIIKSYKTQINPIFGCLDNLFNILKTKYKEYYIKINIK